MVFCLSISKPGLSITLLGVIQIGVVTDLRKARKENKVWLRGLDLNQRPPGYELERSVLKPVDGFGKGE